MCIGVPMQVRSAAGAFAVCEGRGERLRLDCTLIDAPAVGAWVLAFRGAAT